MKLVGYIVVLSVALAVLRGAIIALAIMGVMLLLWGVIFRPHETFGFLAFNLFAEMLRRFPVIVGGAFAALLLVDVLKRWGRGRQGEGEGGGSLNQHHARLQLGGPHGRAHKAGES